MVHSAVCPKILTAQDASSGGFAAARRPLVGPAARTPLQHLSAMLKLFLSLTLALLHRCRRHRLLRANDTAMPALTPRQLSYWRRYRRSDAMSLPASAYVRTCLSFGSTYQSYPSDSACLPAAPATPALVFVLA